MAESTAISWADATFNPWVGCEKVSPGCAHCYAETLVTGRMNRPGTWGAEGIRERTAASTWRHPAAWARKARAGLLPNGESSYGRRPRVFCASLADVFEPRPELEPWRAELFEHVIAATPELDWLVLTKRPELARDWLNRFYDRSDEAQGHAAGARASWAPLPNVWLGTSIENARFTWRADALRECPAAVRFISAEPLLGSLFLGPREGREMPSDGDMRSSLNLDYIDWVIVGGESGGPDARPMHQRWARELLEACLWRQKHRLEDGLGPDIAYGPRPAFHFKQWGSWTPDPEGRDPNGVWLALNGSRRTSFAADAYDDLPDGSMRVRYAGPAPTAGGHHLDGVAWHEFPAVTPREALTERTLF